MNINLSNNYPTDEDDCEPLTYAGEIDDHVLSMKSAGYPITERHVLVPEGPDYPGSYQIWLQMEVGANKGWIHVDAEGVVNHRSNPGEANHG